MPEGLEELAVHNLGLLAEARLEPGPGLVVISGETGTGKTMLIDGLRLLLGLPARSELIGPHGPETTVEGRFLSGGQEVVASRRIVANGRNRSYLNGQMVPLRALERFGSLVEVVSQNDHVTVGTPSAARRLLDPSVGPQLEAYRRAWTEHKATVGRQNEVGGDTSVLERELDMLHFQAGEIKGAGFRPGDDKDLEEKSRRLHHLVTLKEHLSTSRGLLGGVRDDLGSAVAALRRAATLDPSVAEVEGEVSAITHVLDEALAELRTLFESIDQDPDRQEEIEQRMSTLNLIRRKYGNTLDEVLDFGERAAERAEEIEELLASSQTIEAEVAKIAENLVRSGSHLRKARRRAAATLADDTVSHLRELGFSDPVLEIEVMDAAPGPEGADRVEIQFASDRRLGRLPIARGASGGELSRLVLALRLAAGAADAPVVVFDEIDSGVGGRTALALGKKLASLADGAQVLCVTHLPQVAAFATSHYVAVRDGPKAVVEKLDEPERVQELSRMLAGLEESQSGLRHAEELRLSALAALG